MDNKAWYRKYRPEKLEDYNILDIVETIRGRAKSKSLPNIIMVDGPRGCGKTTIARILAKYYMCENISEEGEPCHVCEMCKEINEHIIAGDGIEVMGVEEVNATQMNSKAAIEEILDRSNMLPMFGKHKVLILDECHRISKQGQSSLLKDIEDIKEHLIIILATTNPEQLLDTVKSRVQVKLHVKKQKGELESRLLYIAKQENIHVSREAIRDIVEAGGRVPRESIIILENVYKTYGEVNVANVRKITKEKGSKEILEFIVAANSSLQDIMSYVTYRIKGNEEDPAEFIDRVVKFVLGVVEVRMGIGKDPEMLKSAKILLETYENESIESLLELIENAVIKVKGKTEETGFLIIVNLAINIGKLTRDSKEEGKKGSDSVEVENSKALESYVNKKGISDKEKRDSQNIPISIVDIINKSNVEVVENVETGKEEKPSSEGDEAEWIKKLMD